MPTGINNKRSEILGNKIDGFASRITNKVNDIQTDTETESGNRNT